ANSGANDHAEPVALFQVVHIDPAICHRHFCCGHRKMRKPVGTPHVLWILEERLGIEIADLSPDLAIVPSGIKRVDWANAADAILQTRPKRLKATANRRNNTHTSDDYSALGHDDKAFSFEAWKRQLVPMPTFCTV